VPLHGFFRGNVRISWGWRLLVCTLSRLSWRADRFRRWWDRRAPGRDAGQAGDPV